MDSLLSAYLSFAILVTPTKTKENIRDYTSPTRSSPRILAKVAGKHLQIYVVSKI
jgi:hypothetical protein